MDNNFNPISCSICDKIFAAKSTLKLHKEIVHEIDQIYCDICTKEFPTLDALKCHRDKGHECFQIECDICDKVFKALSALKSHVETFHKSNIDSNDDLIPIEDHGNDSLTLESKLWKKLEYSIEESVVHKIDANNENIYTAILMHEKNNNPSIIIIEHFKIQVRVEAKSDHNDDVLDEISEFYIQVGDENEIQSTEKTISNQNKIFQVF